MASILSNIWQHAEPSSYQLYHKEDPLTGLRNSLGMGVDSSQINTNPGGDVGAARPDDVYNLQPIPGTNFSYDPVSGQYYQTQGVDPRTGQPIYMGANTVAQAPNLSQQGSGNAVLQQLYLKQQQDAIARMAATRAGQTGLERDYRAAIEGRAPSVAAAQLYSGMGHIAQDQASQAAGANGQNAFAARRAAALATGRAQGDLSGQLALVRANETAAARSGLAGLYGQEAQADQAASSTAAGAGVNYGQLGEKSEADRLAANQAAIDAKLGIDKQNAKMNAGILMGAGDAAMNAAKIYGA